MMTLVKSNLPVDETNLSNLIRDSFRCASLEAGPVELERDLGTYPREMISVANSGSEFMFISEELLLRKAERTPVSFTPISSRGLLWAGQLNGKVVAFTEEGVQVLGSERELKIALVEVFDHYVKENSLEVLAYCVNGDVCKVTYDERGLSSSIVQNSPTLQKAIFIEGEIYTKEIFSSSICGAGGKIELEVDVGEFLLDLAACGTNLVVLTTRNLLLLKPNTGRLVVAEKLALTREVDRIEAVESPYVLLGSRHGGSLICSLWNTASEVLWRSQRLQIRLVADKLQVARLCERKLKIWQIEDLSRSISFHRPATMRVDPAPASLGRISIFTASSERVGGPTNVFCATSEGIFFGFSQGRGGRIDLIHPAFKDKMVGTPLQIIRRQGLWKLLFVARDKAIVVSCYLTREMKELCHVTSDWVCSAYDPQLDLLFISDDSVLSLVSLRHKKTLERVSFDGRICSLDFKDGKLLVGDSRISAHAYKVIPDGPENVKLDYVYGDHTGRDLSRAKFLGEDYIFGVSKGLNSCFFLPTKPKELLLINPSTARAYLRTSPIAFTDGSLIEEFEYRCDQQVVDCFEVPKDLRPQFLREFLNKSQTESEANVGLMALILDVDGAVRLVVNDQLSTTDPHAKEKVEQAFKKGLPKMRFLENRNTVTI